MHELLPQQEKNWNIFTTKLVEESVGMLHNSKHWRVWPMREWDTHIVHSPLPFSILPLCRPLREASSTPRYGCLEEMEGSQEGNVYNPAESIRLICCEVQTLDFHCQRITVSASSSLKSRMLMPPVTHSSCVLSTIIKNVSTVIRTSKTV